MERNNAKAPIAEKSQSQRRKKKVEVTTSKSTRSRRSKEVKEVEIIILSSDTSDSDSADRDYASFLETYVPPELSSRASSSGEEDGSRITVESKMTLPEPAQKDSESD
ncbi:hypothetical protein L195_g028785 [Trifolium pratense]|uniref:Uncharacterized protein n=1 Tax=Trifolium pratense TaxID=57577 RepID=A0A2K3L2X0_TRIPR|nr:hypothetical protein L195_g028785 [Trifolium pratense]